MGMDVKIYHNPRCSKSRATLALLRDAGYEPEIILYLEAPPSAERLSELLQKMGLSPRAVIRTKELAYKELDLAAEGLSDSALIAKMVAHPILIDRPIVVVGNDVRLCRPPERVFELIGTD